MIEAHKGRMFPILIFPSGFCSNGSRIMNFKRGVFAALKKVKPLFIKIDLNATVSPAYEVFTTWQVIILQLSWLGIHNIELGIMPEF